MGKCFNEMNEIFRDVWDKWDNLKTGELNQDTGYFMGQGRQEILEIRFK